MFERIFKQQSTQRQHRTGPLLEERLRYLVFKAAGGATDSSLARIACNLLMIARELNVKANAKLSIEKIATLANRWAHRRSRRNYSANVRGCQKRFVLLTVAWFRFLNRLIIPPSPLVRYEPLLSRFADNLEKDLGLAQRTVSGYCWCARKFLTHLLNQGQGRRALDKKTVQHYFSLLARSGYTRAGIRTYAQSLRSFLRFAEAQSLCPPGAAEAIVTPRVFREENLPVGPDWADVERLLASLDADDPKDIRDRAILLLLAHYGLRIDEIRQLQLEDVDWQRDIFFVRRSKQRRSRTYPLSPPLGEAIVQYLKKVRPRTAKDRTLFLRMRTPHKALGVGGLWTIVGRRLRRLGISVARPGPHCLRHARATHLLAQGHSLKEIGDLLGHNSPEATKIYAKVDLASLHEVAAFDLGGLL